MKEVDLLEEEMVEGMQEEEHEHEEEHHEEEYDEHIWTSPKKAINITKSISNAVISSDSKNKVASTPWAYDK